SVARRQLGDAHRAQAEEVAQLVFVDLASKAGRLPSRTVLTGWLFRATIYAARNVLRGELRRQRREQDAVFMENSPEPAADSSWSQLAPHLNSALEQLPDIFRDAILLRFFEEQTLPQLAGRLGVSEAAARKRLSRAVEKLRVILGRRGLAI